MVLRVDNSRLEDVGSGSRLDRSTSNLAPTARAKAPSMQIDAGVVEIPSDGSAVGFPGTPKERGKTLKESRSSVKVIARLRPKLSREAAEKETQVFWMVVFEGRSLPRKSEKSVKIGKNR